MERKPDGEVELGGAVFVDDQGGQEGEGLDRSEVRLELDEEPGEGRGDGDRSRGERDDRGTPRGERNLGAENANLRRALHESRLRGRRLQAQIAEERARRVDEARRAQATSGRPTDEELGRLREADGIAEAAPTLLDMADRRAEQRWIDNRRAIAALSQGFARSQHGDYDRVLKDSGLQDALALDPATGRPRDPETWKRIMIDSDNPGEDAYGLGLALLEERRGGEPRDNGDYSELPPATGSRAEGRREVVRELERSQQRPRGISDLPASGRGGPRRLTRADIDKMSDDEYAALPQNVRHAYLKLEG